MSTILETAQKLECIPEIVVTLACHARSRMGYPHMDAARYQRGIAVNLAPAAVVYKMQSLGHPHGKPSQDTTRSESAE
ncbi:hypothetical protein NDU88_005825 [Pleurodeles waltl]|uniref:Uncharacterized protein n=1 Tax=Pleurodeles waltl TaxID=8319 RepID=A0AAV7SMR3_PLEWA|nr:hypothetical protein NDU88_005825 [Pleurodeles waltl]